MSKQKILNQWARANLNIIDPITVAQMKKGDWRHPPTGFLRCVECGGHRISMPIVAHYGFDGSKIKCYRCQEQSKLRINS